MIVNAPETSDTDFTIRRFAEGANKDLADVFGNLVHRTFVLADRLTVGDDWTDASPDTAEIAVAREIASRVNALGRHH